MIWGPFRLAGQTGEHLAGDQRHPGFRPVEPAGIRVGVFPHHQIVRYPAAAIDHHLGQPGMAADLTLGQHDSLIESGIGVRPDLAEQQRILDLRARDDAAARYQAIDSHAAPVVAVEHELGRRKLLLIGEDRPASVVEVQVGVTVVRSRLASQ